MVSDDTQGRARPSKGRMVEIALRVLVPLAFVVLTVFNVISLVNESRGTTTTGSPTPAQQVVLATLGEIGSSPSAQHTLEAMARKRPDLYLGLGDLSDEGVGSESKWCALVRSFIGPVAPFQLVAGRDEEDGSTAAHLAALAACLPDRLQAQGQYPAQYYFELGKLARVIAIAPNLTIDGHYYYYNKGSAEYAWLKNAITGARTEGTHWIIVAMNDDCISAGQYYCDINQDLMSLLIDDHVDLVLSARDHSYQRSAQIATSSGGCPQVKINTFNAHCRVSSSSTTMHRHAGTVFAVVGSASSNLYNINASNPVTHYMAASMGQNHDPRRGFLLLSVTDSTLSGTFEPSSPGTFTDHFTIHAAKRASSGSTSTSTSSTRP
jgi:hypothetical protein